MFSRPVDIPDDWLRDALRDHWGFAASSLTYQAVGFGSHHWLAADAGGDQLFVTVDDLDTRLQNPTDTTDAAYGRLERAFATALSLRRDAGLTFVIAPVPTQAGRVLARLAPRYSVVVHPVVDGQQAGLDGSFDRPADRGLVLDMLVVLHAARAESPLADDFAVPRLADLTAAMSETDVPWKGGPYGSRARDLLAVHASDLTVLLAVRSDLVRQVAASPGRSVITHGEPHAANFLRTSAGLVLVDWESALLAPPERDLWALSTDDSSVLAAYGAATGVTIDEYALTLYRLSYDLAEVAGYISLFRGDHGDTADSAEAWRNLLHFLRPAERWAGLVPASAASTRS